MRRKKLPHTLKCGIRVHKTYGALGDLNSQAKDAHRNTIFSCSQCTKIYISNQLRKKHMRDAHAHLATVCLGGGDMSNPKNPENPEARNLWLVR
ncbi:hypothetical protein BGX38DRAFT_1189981 [Terfezia claveryi]|nr:hypothetical protein BGX38DRAFT_1189981 [Terfezia claveryi]